MRPIAINPAAAPSTEVGNALGQLAYFLLCAFVFVVPWETTVPELGGFMIGRWLGLSVMGLTAVRLMVLARGRKLCELHYWMLAFAVWSCVSIFWTLDVENTTARIGTYSQLLVLAWIVWELADTEDRVLGLLQSYVFGTYICAIGIIGNLMAGRTTAQMGDYYQGPQTYKTDRYTVSGLDPNELGFMVAVSIPMTLYLIAGRRNGWVKILCWVQLGLSLVTILLSGSRGAMLAATAALGMFPWTVLRLPRRQKILAAVACAGTLVSAAFLVPPETWRRFFNLGTEISEGTMTHRTQIWAASMEVFRNHAFVGVGSGAHPAAVLKILDKPYVAHNTFISVLVELGIVGALLFLALLAAALSSALRMRGLQRALWIVMLATWCVGVSAGTWEYRKTTWLIFSLIAAHVYVGRVKKKPRMLYDRGQFKPVDDVILRLG